jgi:uncharacterized protein (TIGR02284 family)
MNHLIEEASTYSRKMIAEEELGGALRRLLIVCKEGEDGFRAAADAATLPAFRGVLVKYARQRAQFARELCEEMVRLGEEVDEDLLTGRHLRASDASEDHLLFALCETAEDAVKRAYEELLRRALPASLELVLRRQYHGIRDAHDHVRAVRDAFLN